MSFDEQREQTAGELVTRMVEPNEEMLSLRDRLAKRRESIAEHRFVDLDIPGYEGDLFCRYTLLDVRRIRTIGQRLLRQVKDENLRGVYGACDMLIASCEEFWVRDNGKEIRLAEVVGSDIPIRYDEQLADFLKFTTELPDPMTARSVVLELFAKNELAIGAHMQLVSRWMTSNRPDVEDELLGEAMGGL